MSDAGGAVFVVGAGGHAKVVISTLQVLGHVVEAVFDDDPQRIGTDVGGVSVKGPVSQLSKEKGARAVVAVGDNRVRQDLASRFTEIEWITVVHPDASVDASAKLGPGTVVFAGAVIQPDSEIGAHVIVNTGATIDHDCTVGDFVHVAPGTNLAGEVRVGNGAFLGMGAKALPGVRVGEWAIVGAGSVVVDDVSDGATVMGVPAKPTEGNEK